MTLAGTQPFLGGPQSDYRYPAQVFQITDGDTVGAVICLINADLGFGVDAFDTRSEKRWRLASINCPELGTPEGAAAADHLCQVLGVPKRPDAWKHGGDPYVLDQPVECFIVTVKDRKDNYGRYLATIVLDDGTDVNQKMIDDGFAQPWPK